MLDPTRTAIGTWSGGRFMHFGEPLDDERLIALLRPDERVRTVITADAYGAGAADALLGRALEGVERGSYCLVGAVGHDFYEGEREGSKGFPRFTDPRLRGEDGYAGYLRMAAERSLERIGADAFDLLLLHNPDRIGYTSAAVWEGMAALRDAGLTRRLGVAPGPGERLHARPARLLRALRRAARLGDGDPRTRSSRGPASWCSRPRATTTSSLITRVVDYGGLFHDDVLPGHEFPKYDHRGFRPAGWVEAGRAKLERMRPVAERHGLSLLQLACQWNLAHAPVRCVAPTLIQEPGADAKPIEAKREELAALPARGPAVRGRRRRAARDRRQHRLDDAEGRGAGLRGRAAPGPLGAHAAARRARGPLGDRARTRPAGRVMDSLRGKLLLAAPALKDPNFDRTVVFIAEHSEDGAMGLVLNRPSDAPVAEAIPDLEWVADSGAGSVYVGGPVAPNGVIVLAEWEDPSQAVVLVEDDLGFVPGDAEDTDALAAAVRRARVYAGHAGWGPGQLEDEIEEEAWIVESPLREELFSDDPEGLWSAVLRRKGREFALLSTMPPDPSLN